MHQVMSSSRILPRCSSSTCGVLKGAFQNMPQSNVRKEPPPACHRQGEVVPYVCIRPLHPFPSTSTRPRLAATGVYFLRSDGYSEGIRVVSGSIRIVFRVFGFFAQQQVLHIPHLALLQIPTNYPFHNIKGGECGIREG